MKRIALGPQEQIAADQFRSFYAGLLAIRDAINVVPAAAAEPGSAPPGCPSIEDVRTRLTRAIGEFGFRTGDTAQLSIDPGYVMAAVADEVLLTQCPGWVDREAWTDRPLESFLYGSGLAGERIFDAADALVARLRVDSCTATSILLALLIGFRGRYHGRNDHGRVAALEAGLYALVCDRPYLADDPAPYAATPLAATTLEGASMRRLPALWPWLLGLAVLLLAYLPISHLEWWLQVRPVARLAASILADNDRDSAGNPAR